jgi:hypothetical protein
VTSITQIPGRSAQIAADSTVWTPFGVNRAAEERTGNEWTGGDWDDLAARAAAYLAQLCRACEYAYLGIPDDTQRYLVSLLKRDEVIRTHPFSRVYACERDSDSSKDDIVVWWPRAFRELMIETVLGSAPRCVFSRNGGADA